MITNVSSLQRPLFTPPQRGGGGATKGTGPAGADEETSASTDGNAATQDYKGSKDAKGTKGLKNGKDGKDTDSDGEKRDATGLTEGERKQLKELKSRDNEVRNHENAHQSSGGQLAGSPSYTYQAGPDGQRYAIGGEVSIDVSPEDDPAATIAKMQRVSRAATAPAEPSPQDFKVAAAAQRMMAEAQRDLDAAKLDKLLGGGDTGKSGETAKTGEAGSQKEQDGEKAQAKATSSAAVASAMQAYQSAAALVRSSRAQTATNA